MWCILRENMRTITWIIALYVELYVNRSLLLCCTYIGLQAYRWTTLINWKSSPVQCGHIDNKARERCIQFNGRGELFLQTVTEEGCPESHKSRECSRCVQAADDTCRDVTWCTHERAADKMTGLACSGIMLHHLYRGQGSLWQAYSSTRL